MPHYISKRRNALHLPSGISGKQVQMYCAIHTKRRSSLSPDPKEVIAGVLAVLLSLALAMFFRVMLQINCGRRTKSFLIIDLTN